MRQTLKSCVFLAIRRKTRPLKVIQTVPVNAISELCAHIIQHFTERWFWFQVIIFWLTWSRYWVTSLGKSLRYCSSKEKKEIPLFERIIMHVNFWNSISAYPGFWLYHKHARFIWLVRLAGARPKQSRLTFHQPRVSGQVSYNPYAYLEKKAVPFPITATTFVMW